MAFHKLKEKIQKFHHKPATSHHGVGFNDTGDASLTREEIIYRYRKQRGVNLGSWFVHERWICESTFLNANAVPPAQSDLDIARGTNAKQALETHWDTWIQEPDWKWMADRGLNAVRIPIGYYHLCGVDPSVLEGTDFQGFQHVFEGAWSRITRTIEMAYKYDMGVLIDLHAALGKQNPDSHSGTSKPPTFFTDAHNRNRTTEILCILLTNLSKFVSSHDPRLPNVIGIELLNEPQPSSDQELMKWYTTTIRSLRQIDAGIPIYIGDCWKSDQYADYIASDSLSFARTGLIALDHHLYRVFTESDIRTSATEHAENVKRDMKPVFSRIDEKLGRAHGGLVVGEWSAALNPGSIRGDAKEEMKKFAAAQLEVYESNACGGWFFWTYKKQWRGDMGWSLVDAVEGGVFPSWIGLRRVRGREEELEGRRAKREMVKRELLNVALHDHTTYWARYPGRYNHSLFEQGFSDGWDEEFRFFDVVPSRTIASERVSELGFVRARAYSKSRMRAPENETGASSYWEYEHGFIQGVETSRRSFQEEL